VGAWSAGTVRTVELVGRRREVEVLRSAFERAATGRRTVLRIRGEPGIGKTRLLDELVAFASERDAVVVRSAATEVESGLGWAAVANLVRAIDPEMVGMLPSWNIDVLDAIIGRRPRGGFDSGEVAAAFAELLRLVSAHRTTLVIVDDLQWIDQASAGAIAHTLRHVVDRPVLLVAATRPVAGPLDLDRLAGPDLVNLEPTPLSLAATRTLLVSSGVMLGRIDQVRVHEVTQGNPLHLTETTRLLASGVALDDALVPASLREIVETVLGRIPADDIAVLAAAALMPSPSVALLVGLFGVDTVERSLTSVASNDVVSVGADDSIRFRHPLFRTGLADRLSVMERRRIHRRCAEGDVAAEVRAFHLGAAMSGPDPEIADVLESTANNDSSQGLHDAALAHALKSLEATPTDDRAAWRRRALLAADLALTCGEPRRTLDLIQGPLDELDRLGAHDAPVPDDAAWLLRTAAVAHANVHGVSAALPLLERGWAVAAVGSVERRRISSDLALVLAHDDVERSRQFCAVALAEAIEVGDTQTVQELQASLDVALVLAGHPVDLPTDDPRDAVSVEVLVDRLSAAVWTDDLPRAEAVLAAAWQKLERVPRVVNEHNLFVHEVDLRTRQGRLDVARARIDQAWMLAEDPTSTTLRSAEAIALAVAAADEEAVNRHLAVLEAARAEPTSILRAQMAYAFGVVGAARGHVTQAIEHLAASARALDEASIREVGALPVLPRLVEVQLLGDRVDGARRVADLLVEYSERSRRPRAAAEAARAQGLVRAADGDVVGAVELLRAALEGFTALGLVIERIRSLTALGGAVRRLRQRGEARALLDLARSEAIACGALGLLPNIDAELDRLGARSGVDELTNTERQVVDLVRRGRSNAEVAAELHLSVRTVESNLTRIYRKLGVRGRSELIAQRPSF
jgi:DNA-binding CsgD family transcriptional regulator